MSVSVKRFPKRPVDDYAKIRGQIQSGDVLLCSGSGWFSQMIQAATESVWSHVAFVMRLEVIDRIMVLESVEPIGVRTVPLSKYLRDYNNDGNPYPGRLAILRHKDFHRLVSAPKLKKMGQFAVQLFGYPYDKEEIAKIAARIVSSHLPFSKGQKKKLKRNREYICSEYVWECYRSVGIKVPYDKMGFIAPADFARTKEFQLEFVLK